MLGSRGNMTDFNKRDKYTVEVVRKNRKRSDKKGDALKEYKSLKIDVNIELRKGG